ncbi:MAG: hypothetical protein KJ990_12695 [Proteobacteria bacterium]|nr:hypothetical protein [Pseudomonadota bacterium]MBU1648204.1 hypothetical protein [Pseudomonadota bacterium]
MTPRQIRGLLVTEGITLVSIAKDLHVSAAAISQAISHKTVSKRIREEIARRLNKKASDLWKKAA